MRWLYNLSYKKTNNCSIYHRVHNSLAILTRQAISVDVSKERGEEDPFFMETDLSIRLDSYVCWGNVCEFVYIKAKRILSENITTFFCFVFEKITNFKRRYICCKPKLPGDIALNTSDKLVSVYLLSSLRNNTPPTVVTSRVYPCL